MKTRIIALLHLIIAAAAAAPVVAKPNPFFLTPGPYSRSDWSEVGRYRNYGVYSTNVMSRLIKSDWDPIAESKTIIFQLNAQGKDVGAMEFDVVCSNAAFTFERKIPVPTSGARWFSENAMHYFQQASMLQRVLTVVKTSALSSDSNGFEGFGQHLKPNADQRACIALDAVQDPRLRNIHFY